MFWLRNHSTAWRNRSGSVSSPKSPVPVSAFAWASNASAFKMSLLELMFMSPDQPQQFVFRFPHFLWRAGRELPFGHAAVVHDLRHSQPGIHKSLQGLRDLPRRTVWNDLLDGLDIDF